MDASGVTGVRCSACVRRSASGCGAGATGGCPGLMRADASGRAVGVATGAGASSSAGSGATLGRAGAWGAWTDGGLTSFPSSGGSVFLAPPDGVALRAAIMPSAGSGVVSKWVRTLTYEGSFCKVVSCTMRRRSSSCCCASSMVAGFSCACFCSRARRRRPLLRSRCA